MRYLLVAALIACGAPAPLAPPATTLTPAPAPVVRPSRAPDPVDADGRTPLHIAAQAGDLATITRLLDAGAALDPSENIYRHTPLLLALEYSEPEAAMLLLQRGAAADQRALALAARGGAEDVVAALLSHGLPVAGSFALHRAAKYGHTAVIERLLAAGAAVDEVEPGDQWTALHIASMENKLAAARVLLAAGASVKPRDDDGNQPLHWAVFGARPNEIHEYSDLGGPHDTYYEPQAGAPLVELLLSFRAPVDALDGDGDTALHLAATYDAANAVTVLLRAGADRNVRNRDGKTAYQLASARNNSTAALLASPRASVQQ